MIEFNFGIPESVCWLGLAVLIFVGYSICGAITAGILHRTTLKYDIDCAVSFGIIWPLIFIFFFVYWTLLLPARLIFGWISKSK